MKEDKVIKREAVLTPGMMVFYFILTATAWNHFRLSTWWFIVACLAWIALDGMIILANKRIRKHEQEATARRELCEKETNKHNKWEFDAETLERLQQNERLRKGES